MALFSRSFRRRLLRFRMLLLTFTLILLFDTHAILSYHPTPVRTSTLPSHLANEKIFIASINRNSEYMLRLYWSDALLKLVTHLGPQNVFVSIYESGSQEDTKGALRELEASLNTLGAENKIMLGMTVQEQLAELTNVPGPDQDRTGWIFTGRNVTGWEVRRIPYLASLRNKVMEPLVEMEHRRRFDRVLWINDVVFTTEDVITVLSTRDGDYDAACALDFSNNAETYYDTFALRDIDGHKTSTLTYPYFYSANSRRALLSLQPIPVQSCWNGLISLAAAPFYSTPSTPAVKFRGVPDSLAKQHLEGSECCLIHSDIRSLSTHSSLSNPPNSAIKPRGVYLNPNVRVAFNASTYSAVNGDVEVKSVAFDIVDRGPLLGAGLWPGQHEKWVGMWLNRYARLTFWVKMWGEERMVRRRVQKWVKGGEVMSPSEMREEVGTECLINEMQVLFMNGWQHI